MKLKMNSQCLKDIVSANSSNYRFGIPSGTGGVSALMSSLGDVIDHDGALSGGSNYTPGFLVGLTGNANSTWGGSYAWPTYSGLYIMSGAMPTQAAFDTFMDTFVSGSVNPTGSLSNVFRYSDMLVAYAKQTATVVAGTCVCSFVPTAAQKSGTATWFMFGSWGGYYSSGWRTPAYIVAGTITDIGGGGDIEMLNRNIVSGTAYRIPQYELRFPTKFSS